MKLTTKGRYAVMAMADLAQHSRDPAGPAGGPADRRAVCLADIAQRQGISLAYLEQIFARLRRSGLVISVRGPGGGYRLARDAEATSISAIVAAADEPLRAVRCAAAGGGCLPGGGRCLTHDLWAALGDEVDGFLRGVSLADVLGRSVRSRRAEAVA